MNDGEKLRVVAKYGAPNSSQILNVFMYEYAGAGDTDADVLTACDTFFTSEWGSDWANLASDDFTFDEIELDVLNTSGTVKRNIGSTPIGLTGNLAPDMSPIGACYLLSADTIEPKQRGRKYVPGLDQDGVIDGLLTAARLVTAALLAVEYLDTITGILAGELTPGVLSRTLIAFEPFIASGSITDVPAYQRRRKPNVGS